MKATEIKVTGYESRVTPTGLNDTEITVAVENVTAIVNITTGFYSSYCVSIFNDGNRVASIYAGADKVTYEAKKVTESKVESFCRDKGLYTSIYTSEKMKEYKTVKNFVKALANFDLTLDDIWTLSNAAIDAMIKIRDEEKAELNLVDNFIAQAVKDDEITADLISKGEINANAFFENLANGDESYIACVELPTSYEAGIACRVMDKAGLTDDYENCLYTYSCSYTWLNRIELKRNALVEICKAYNRPTTFKLYEAEIADVINQRLIDATDEICTADAVEASVEATEAAINADNDVAESAIEYEANAFTSKTEYGAIRNTFKTFSTATAAYKWLVGKRRRYAGTTYFRHVIEKIVDGVSYGEIYSYADNSRRGEETSDPDIQALIDAENFNCKVKTFLKDCADYAKAMKNKANSENAAKISAEIKSLWSEVQTASVVEETAVSDDSADDARIAVLQSEIAEIEKEVDALFDKRFAKYSEITAIMEKQAKAAVKEYGLNEANVECYTVNGLGIDFRINLDGELVHAHSIKEFKTKLKAAVEAVSRKQIQTLINSADLTPQFEKVPVTFEVERFNSDDTTSADELDAEE